MSRQIDERVVQMEFDNQKFEKNVKESMSTLDKLKKALKIDKAAESLEDLQKVGDRFNLDRVGKSVEYIADQFNLLGKIGQRIKEDIAGYVAGIVENFMSIPKKLSLDQISAGWEKYGDKASSVQTIMSATGKSVEEVENQMKKLMWFTDETSYSFTDMSDNIGKFTNAGVDLETATTAMIGISNWAAVSGANVEQAGRAMYNLSQAMAVGQVKLMDWRSIESATMSTVEFKQNVIDTAVELGTLAEVSEGVYETMNGTVVNAENMGTTLAEGWFTSDVLLKTLNLYGEYTEEVYKAKRAGESAGETMERLGDLNMEMGEKAFKAAQEYRTAKDVMNAGMDAVSTKWMGIFQLIFGNAIEAKEWWSELGGVVYDVFAAPLDSLTETLTPAMQDNWAVLRSEVEATGIAYEEFEANLIAAGKEAGKNVDWFITNSEDFADSLQKYGWADATTVVDALNMSLGTTNVNTEEVAASMEDLESVAKRVIRGEFGNGQARYEALTAAGYDYNQVQRLVTKMITGEEIALTDLTDEQLKNLNYTDEQIAAIRALVEELEDENSEIHNIANNISKPSGRQLLLESVQNLIAAGYNLASIFTEAKDAVFEGLSSDGIYSFIERLNELSAKVKDLFGKWSPYREDLVRTFRGIYAAVDIVWQAIKAVAGGIKDILSALFPSKSGMKSFLDFTGGIGDMIFKFDQMIKETGLFKNAIGSVVSVIVSFINTVKNFFGQIPKYFDKMMAKIKVRFPKWDMTWDGLKNAVSKFFSDFGINVSEGLKKFKEKWNEFSDTIKSSGTFAALEKSFGGLGEVFSTMWGLIKRSYDKLSPVLKSLAKMVKDTVGSIWGTIKTAVKTGDTDTLFSALEALFAGGLFLKLRKDSKYLKGTIEGVLGKIEKLGDRLASVLNGFSLKVKAQALKEVAVAIAILSGSLLVLSSIEPTKLGYAVGAMIAVIAALSGMMLVMQRFKTEYTSFSSIGDMFKSRKSDPTFNMIKIATALFILSGAVVKLGKLNPSQLKQGLGAMAALMLGLFLIIKNMPEDRDIGKIGSAFRGMGLALVIVAGAFKIMETIEPETLTASAAALGGTIIAMTEVMLALKYVNPGAMKQAGRAFEAMGLSLILISSAFAIMGTMEWGDIGKGAAALGGALVLFTIFAGVAGAAGTDFKGMGLAFIGLAAALVTLAGAFFVFQFISWEGIAVGLTALAGALTLVVLAAAAVKHFGLEKSLITLSWAILKMGVSVFLVGAGLKLLAAGLVALAAAGAAATGAAYVILEILEIILNGLLDWGIEAAPKVADLFITLIREGVRALADSAEAIAIELVDTLLVILNKLVENNNLKVIVDDLVLILIAIIDGLAEHMPELIVSIVNLLDKIFEGLKEALENMTEEKAAMLVGIIFSMTQIVHLLAKAKKEYKDAFKVGISMTIIMGAIAGVFYLIKDVDGSNMAKQAAGIAGAVLSLSKAVVWLKGAGWADGARAAVNLIEFIGVLMGGMSLVGGLIYLVNEISDELGGSATAFQDSLALVGESIGAFIGALVGATGSYASKYLPDIGKNLSSFATEAEGFFGFLDTLTPERLKAFGNILGVLEDLTATAIWQAIAEWIGLDLDFEALTTQLVDFGEAMSDFAEATSSIDPEQVKSAAGAGFILTSLYRSFPREGGAIQWLIGETKDAGELGQQLVEFGKAMVEYKTAVGDLKQEDVEDSVAAATLLNEFVHALPRENGVIPTIFEGELQNPSEFGDNMIALAYKMVMYSLQAKRIDTGAISSSATALNELLNVTSGIDLTATGDWAIASVGGIIQQLGIDYNSYYGNIAEFDKTKLDNASTALSSLLGTVATADDVTNLENLSTSLSLLSTFSVSGFVESFENSGTRMFEAGVNAITQFKNGIENTGGATEVTTVAQEVVKAVEVEIAAYNESFEKAGVGIINKFARGIKLQRHFVKPSIEKIFYNSEEGEGILTYIESLYEEFNTKGVETAGAFIDGIVSKAKNIWDTWDYICDNVLDNKIGGEERNKEFKDAGANLAEQFNKGVDSATNGSTSIDTTDIQALSEALKEITTFSVEDMVSDFEGAGTKMYDAGKAALEQFIAGITETSGTLDQVSQATEALSFITTITEWITNKSDSIERAGTQLSSKFLKGFKSNKGEIKTTLVELFTSVTSVPKGLIPTIKSYKDDFYNEAIAIMGAEEGFLAGIVEEALSVYNVIGAMLDTMVSKIKNRKDSSTSGGESNFYDAGKACVQGLADGIDANSATAEGAAKDLAENVLDYVKKKLDINSPSGEFKKIGVYVVQGFAKGLNISSAIINKALKKTFGKRLTRIADSIRDQFGGSLKKAKRHLRDFVTEMYKETDAYKENSKKLKKLRKELEKENLEEDKRKDILKEIKELEKQMVEDEQEVFNEFYDRIYENVKSFVNLIELELESTIDLFAEMDDMADDSLSSALDILNVFNETEEETSSLAESLNVLNATTEESAEETDKYASSLDILKAKVDDTSEETEEATEKQEKYVDILKSTAEEAKEAAKYVSILDTELNSTVDTFEAFSKGDRIGSQSIIKRMTSQLKGVQNYYKDLDELSAKGVSDAMLAKLREMGPSGANYVDAFLRMTEEQIKEANTLLVQQNNLSTRLYLEDMEANTQNVRNWADNLAKLSKRGISDGLLKELTELGVSGADKVAYFVSMTENQFKRLNRDYEDSATATEYAAKKIAKITASYSEKLAKEQAKAERRALLDKMSEDVKAVREWSNNLVKLQNRGLNEALLQDLASLGYSGATQAALYVSMTDEELSELNAVYEKQGKANKKAAKVLADILPEAVEESKEATAAETLDAMKQQTDGVIKWSKNMKKLAKRGLAEGLIQELVEAGPDSAEQVAMYLAMTDEEFKLLNARYDESARAAMTVADNIAKATKSYTDRVAESERQAIVDSMAAQTNAVEQWSKNLEKLKKKGLDQAILQQLIDAGPSNADQVAKYLTLTKQQIEQFNKEYGRSIATAESVSKRLSKITKDYAKEMQKQATEDVIKSMFDQTESVNKWYSNLKKLKKRGLDEGFLKSLVELGVDGSAQVETFVSMTEEQLKKVNEAFAGSQSAAETLQKGLAGLTKGYDKSQAKKALLDGMRAQLDAAKDYSKDIKKLRKIGLEEGLLREVEALGQEGADKVKAFLAMTVEEVDLANAMYKEKIDKSNKDLLAQMKTKIDDAKRWASNIAALEARGANKKLIEELVEKGPDSLELTDILMNMSDEDFKKYNKLYKQSLKLPESVTDDVIASYVEAGHDSAKGFAQGILNGEESVVNATKQVSTSALLAVKETLGINSPSKEFAKLGDFAGLGFVGSLLKYADTAYDSSAEIADETIAGLSNALAPVLDILGDDLDFTPVITPVVDLNEVNKGIGLINSGMSDVSALDLDANVKMAGSIAKEFQHMKEEASSDQAGTTNYTFNQYNTSPKALSRLDIYRQTRNQFAMLKGAKR